jgi:hypothetical protein
VVLSVFIGYRSTRSDSSSVDSIQLLNDKAYDIEKMAMESARMSLEELEEHLLAASWELFGVMSWVLANTPRPWRVDATSSRAEARDPVAAP